MADQDISAGLYALYNIVWALAMIVIGLRVVARRLARVSLWWDDFLILGAGFVQTVAQAFLMIALGAGGGKHVQDVDPRRIPLYILMTYANEYVYVVTITLIQLSLLCLYIRIFRIDRTFTLMAYGYIALVLCWAIALLFSTVFQCYPVDLPYSEGYEEAAPHCINFRAWLIGTNVPHIFIDFSMLLLPVRQVWKLSLSRAQKVGISAVFLLGTFTSAVSIVRTYYNSQLQLTDPTWNYTPVEVWSSLEAWVGIIAACLPTLGPLARYFWGKEKYSRGSKRRGYELSGDGTKRLGDPHSSQRAIHTPSPEDNARHEADWGPRASSIERGASPPAAAAQSHEYSPGEIYMTREYDIQTKSRW